MLLKKITSYLLKNYLMVLDINFGTTIKMQEKSGDFP